MKTRRERLWVYKGILMSLERYCGVAEEWYFSGFCEYLHMVEGDFLTHYPELYKYKPLSKNMVHRAFWFKPYDTIQRLEIIKKVIEDTKESPWYRRILNGLR